MQYTVIFHGCKTVIYKRKNMLFLLKTLIVCILQKLLIEAALMSTHNLCLEQKQDQRTYGPVNTHLISEPSIRINHTKPD